MSEYICIMLNDSEPYHPKSPTIGCIDQLAPENIGC